MDEGYSEGEKDELLGEIMVYTTAPQGPAPVAGGKRPAWHWAALGCTVLAGLTVVTLLGVLILVKVLGRGDPEHTLEDFYTSLETTDCELFMDSTTEDFRETTGITTCEIFDENLGGISGVDYTVEDRTNRQGYAIFDVTETYVVDGQEVDVPLQYFIRRIDGQWDLDGIILVDPEAEPIT